MTTPAGDPVSNTTTAPSAAEAVAQHFQMARLAVLSDHRGKAERQALLRNLVEFLKIAASDRSFPWDTLTVPRDVNLVIQYTDQKSGPGLIMTIQRLQVEHLAGRSDVVILLRDRSSRIKFSAASTRKALNEFIDDGGHFVEVEPEWLADFKALVLLRRAVEAGEIVFGHGDKATIGDVRSFMRKEFQSGLIARLGEIVQKAIAVQQGDQVPPTSETAA